MTNPQTVDGGWASMMPYLHALREPVVILGIILAAIALFTAVVEKRNDKPPKVTLMILAILGFIVLVAQQVVGAKLEEQGTDQTTKILQKVSETVTHTDDLVTDFSERVRGLPLGAVGEPLVEPDVTAHSIEELLSKGKEAVAGWDSYAKWVRDKQQGKRLALAFELRGGHNYMAWMTLAYLFASPETENGVRQFIHTGYRDAWFTQSFLDRALLDWHGVDFVLFVDHNSRRVAAYAEAREFAMELLFKQRIGEAGQFDRILNNPSGDPATALAQAFHSVRRSIATESDTAKIVKTMLENKWPECLADAPDGRFLVRLENVVRAAK